jgi:hypothetical protein
MNDFASDFLGVVRRADWLARMRPYSRGSMIMDASGRALVGLTPPLISAPALFDPVSKYHPMTSCCFGIASLIPTHCYGCHTGKLEVLCCLSIQDQNQTNIWMNHRCICHIVRCCARRFHCIIRRRSNRNSLSFAVWISL